MGAHAAREGSAKGTAETPTRGKLVAVSATEKDTPKAAAKRPTGAKDTPKHPGASPKAAAKRLLGPSVFEHGDTAVI